MEYSTIGLECGKNVAAKVDDFLKTTDWVAEFRKKICDERVIYKWRMKWYTPLFKDEARLIDVLSEFDDTELDYDAMSDEDYYNNAYKLCVIGDEGSEDEYCNSAGFDSCLIHMVHDISFE